MEWLNEPIPLAWVLVALAVFGTLMFIAGFRIGGRW